MTTLHALILGVVEGLTEFLPVSSTAHLILANRALGSAADEFAKSFEIIIQLAAILAVVVLYWRRFLDVRLLSKLAVAFVPTGVIGLTVYKALKQHLLGNVPLAAATLFVGGVLLIVFERLRPHALGETADYAEITYGRAFLVGIFQSIAIIPGVSRSAATIIGGSMIGISRRTIVEFSFLLAVPTMAAAAGLDLLKSHAAFAGHGTPLAIGLVVSFATAMLAITSLIRYLKRHDFTVFGVYRILVAAAYFVLA